MGFFFMNSDSRVYKGWIPTVSGRLSFDVIGTGSHPNPPDCTNVEDRSARYVLCKQERILLDNAIIFFKEKAAKHLYGEVGRFYFICIGTSSNDPQQIDGSLSGFLYIYHPSVWNEAIYKKFAEYQENLLSYWKQPVQSGLIDFFNDAYLEVQQLLQAHSYFYVPFVMQRNGVTTLTITDNCFENPGAPIINSENPHIEHSVSSQAFFFLKDILHNHQHHDPYTDTLSDVFIVKCEEEDYAWRCEIVRLLYRMILTYKRNRKEEICNSALGLIAYVRSFKSISDVELSNNSRYLTLGNKLLPDLNDNLLQESIKASQDSLRNYIQDKIRKSDKITNIILAFLTTILSVIGILQITKINYEQEDVSVFFVFLSWIVLTQPLLCLAWLSLIAIFFAERWGVLSFKRRSDLYRVIITQGQREMEWVLNIIGLIAIAATILLVANIDKIVFLVKTYMK